MTSHAYMLSGGSSESRMVKAREAAAGIIGGARAAELISEGACEDFISLTPEGAGGSYTVAQMDELSAALRLRPLAGDRRVFVIDDADALTPSCQNKLLKNLEEPPGSSVIFLLADNPMSLLATIRSRLVHIRMDGETDIPAPALYEEAKEILSMILFRDMPYSEITKRLDEFKEAPAELLDAMIFFLREMRVGRRAPALLRLAGDEAPASRIKASHDAVLSRAAREAEKTVQAINTGRNAKYALHDMILRMRMKD